HASAAQADEVIEFGHLHADVAKREVRLTGKPVNLTSKEFDLLLHFLRNPGRVYTRLQLLDAVWGYGYDGYEHNVNCHINRPSAVQQVFDRIRVVNPRIDVYLLDEVGHVVAASGQNSLKRTTVDLGPVQRFLSGEDELPIVGDDPSVASGKRVFSVAPVPLAG